MKGKAVLSLCAIAFLMLATSSGIARADGNGATTFTQTFHNAIQTMPSNNPCSGAPGTLTSIYNGVFHSTALASGEFWATSTLTGDFNFVPTDPSQPSFTGHFETWFGVSVNNLNFVQHSNLNVHGIGSDGSTITFHDIMHFSVSASGVTISFDKPTCG